MKRYSFHGVHEIDAKPTDDIDGEWIRYEDHVEAMKRVAGEGRATAVDAAAFIERKADDYAREFGTNDMGSLSFGNEDMRIYHWDLVELADEIRELAAPAPSALPAEESSECPDCHGVGRVEVTHEPLRDGYTEIFMECCDTCQGTGKVDSPSPSESPNPDEIAALREDAASLSAMATVLAKARQETRDILAALGFDPARCYDEHGNLQIGVVNDAIRTRDEMPAPVASPADQVEIERLRRISWLIGSIFVHGNFVAETFNERELESLLRKQGTFWETLSEFDAAMSASKEGA